MDVERFDRLRLLVLCGASLGIAAAAPVMTYDALVLIVAAVILLVGAVWIALRPAVMSLPDGVLAGALMGIGPAFTMGYWAWWWSDFCIFDCAGVTRDPMEFIVWSIPVLVGSTALGMLAAWLGSQHLQGPKVEVA